MKKGKNGKECFVVLYLNLVVVSPLTSQKHDSLLGE